MPQREIESHRRLISYLAPASVLFHAGTMTVGPPGGAMRRRRRGDRMRRRQFIALIGAASTWPFISGATENALPVIGFVHPSSAVRTGDVMEAFNRGLGESGYVVGKDVTIEYHWANDDYALLPGIFRGLADRKIAVMFVGTPVAAKAAKRAGLAMPIVFC